ncbi:uncharacterized protein NEMAJ01_1611 [Nematocida major]|uniref:uncharacterized protein n=1 Tax=Nematocida major TaxID=1912982 RepID=UPI0020085C58|nr:uncharacterized protein NEMAJ01_1611 [Nematocida major]KAH9386715.1 hypothetical protein NEMAJ01_1611 [Nematocida major]
MKILALYAKAKQIFPFLETSAPLVKFLPRRAGIDGAEYRYESAVKICKTKRIAEDPAEEDIKKKVKKTKKFA